MGESNLVHRLELALKDALKGTLFTVIDEMLLRVYYLYKNSPKEVPRATCR